MTLFGQSTSHLVNKEGARHAARLRQIRQGDVIIHDDHFHLATEGTGAFRCKTKIQTIAGVVLDDQQAARLPRHFQNARENGFHRGRCEHLATHRCSEHTGADEACMGRLMA